MRFLIAIGMFVFSVTTQAALLGRAPATAGGTDYQAYYDDVQNITWLADANYAVAAGFDADGAMTWDDSMTFVGTLDGYLGAASWRLPEMTDVGNDGCPGDPADPNGIDCGYNVDTATGEMASMFYDTLGNLAFFAPDGSFPQPGWGLTEIGPFANLQSVLYWYGTELVTDPTGAAWYFGMPSGAQRPNGKTELYYAWAVTDGDALAPVPVPAAAWLFGSALGLLGWLRRRS